MGIPQLNFDRIQVVDPTQGALDAVNSAKSSLNDILRQGLAEEEVAQNKLVQDRDYAMRVKADARIGTEFDQKQSARSARQKFNEVYGKGPQAVIVDGLVTDEFVADGGQEGVEKRLGIAAPVVNKETGVVVYTPEDQKKLDNYYGAFSNIVDKRSAMLGNETELELLGRAEKAAEEGGYDPEIADIVKAGRAAEISRIDTLRKALEADKTLAEKDRIEAGGKAVKSNLVTTGTSSYSDSVNRTKSLGGEASGKTKDSSGGVDLGHSAELKDMTIKQIKDEVGLSFGDEAKADAKIKEAIDKGFSYKQIHAMLSQSVDLSWTGDTIDTAMMDKLMSKAKPESTSNGDGTETRESSSRSNSRSSSTTSHGFMANPAEVKFWSGEAIAADKRAQMIQAKIDALSGGPKDQNTRIRENVAGLMKDVRSIPTTVPVETTKPVVKSAPEARKVAPVKSAVQKNIKAPKGELKAPPPLVVVPKQAVAAPKVVRKPVYDPKNPEAYIKAAKLLVAQKEALKRADAKKREDALRAKIRADNALKRKNTELRLLRAKMGTL